MRLWLAQQEKLIKDRLFITEKIGMKILLLMAIAILLTLPGLAEAKSKNDLPICKDPDLFKFTIDSNLLTEPDCLYILDGEKYFLSQREGNIFVVYAKSISGSISPKVIALKDSPKSYLRHQKIDRMLVRRWGLATYETFGDGRKPIKLFKFVRAYKPD